MSGAQSRPPGRVAIAARAVVIAAILGSYLLPAAAVAAWLALVGRGDAGRRHAWRRVVLMMQRLGPAFVKAGQILGTRRDVLPEALCRELSALRCRVRPISPARAEAALRAAYGDALHDVFSEVDLRAVAAGSIACVYRARLRDGREVAVKLKRPGVAAVMARDLALLSAAGRLLGRLAICRRAPVRAVVAQLCAAAASQLDFEREAASLTRLREQLAWVPRVRVPCVHAGASRPGALVMEFIPALQTDTPDRCSPVARHGFAVTTLQAMYHMLFLSGFVHCDLHRGNLYFTERGQVVILDAGFSVQLTERLRRLFAEFFMYLSQGAGRRCAEIVIESAAAADGDADREGFIRQMSRLVERSSRQRANAFSLIAFATQMFDLQRRSGFHGATELVFPLLSLLVIEGTVRELDPEIDFQEAARSTVMRAVFGAPVAVPS